VPPIENQKSKIKNVLAARGLAPRKSFGQNFMVDSNFAAAVARAARADERTLILEVGPGTGCLTEALLASHPAARVLAVEIDRGLAAFLRETLADPIAQGRLTLLEGDALAGKHALAPALVQAALEISATENRPRRVLCANLPYNAATPILMNLAADAEGLAVESAVATIQTELAERLLAGADDAAYGAPSAFLALRATGKILRRVGNEVFWPRPQVASAVVRLDFRPFAEDSRPEGPDYNSPGQASNASAALGSMPQESAEALKGRANAAGTDARPSLLRAETAPFQQFLRKLFSQRRKTIRGTLKLRELPAALHLPPTARAEELAPDVLLALYRFTTEAQRHSEE